ncbi:MAG: hypothetical protein QXK80_01135 [Candidatus Pacearchaeota archaeon]
MNNEKLADIIVKALGIGALVGIGAIVWKFGLNPAIKDERDLKRIMNPESTITYNGTIWSSWKKYGKPYGVKWDIWMKGIVDYNKIRNPDFPGTYKVPILEKND